MTADDADAPHEVVPETRLLAELDAEAVWRERRELGVQAGHRLRQPRRLSRRQDLAQRFEEVRREPGYLAQRRVEPGEVRVETSDGPLHMKFDVRAYAYRDEILLLGARVYQGQVTNLRSPGGGFSAICVARTPEDPC